METQISFQPPSNRVIVIGCSDDDYIQDLGNQIVNLTLLQARDLVKYLQSYGIKFL